MTSLHTSRSEWQCWPDSEVDRIDLTAHGQRGSTIAFAIAKVHHPILQHGSIDLHDSRHRFTTGAVQNQLFDDRSGPRQAISRVTARPGQAPNLARLGISFSRNPTANPFKITEHGEARTGPQYR